MRETHAAQVFLAFMIGILVGVVSTMAVLPFIATSQTITRYDAQGNVTLHVEATHTPGKGIELKVEP